MGSISMTHTVGSVGPSWDLRVVAAQKYLFLKGPSHQIRSAWKWYGQVSLGRDMRAGLFKILKGSL
jgi:hypothetical protein